MGRYKHITWTERLEIERLFNHGCTYRAIAKRLGRAVSSIHREIQRGLYEHLDGATWTRRTKYSAQISQDRSDFERSAHGAPLKLGHRYDYAQLVAARILAGESPDAIVGDLRRRGEWTVSTPTLYRYIDQGFIPGITNKQLLIKGRRRSKRVYRRPRAARAAAGLSIELRPPEILDRIEFGHWEMDTVVGQSRGRDQSILVLTERKTRYEQIFKLPMKTSAAVLDVVHRLISGAPAGVFRSITVDNGTEFSGAHQLPIPVYYCHPYCSSERGSNENCNRIIRRFFPKGSSFAAITQADCDYVAARINSMHRKILGFCTASEVFEACLNSL